MIIIVSFVCRAFLIRICRAAFIASFLLTIAACSDGNDIDDGYILNNLVLPLDNALVLHCPNVGIADEFCILDDPANPYARAAITDATKFELAGQSPSPKSDFYLWGTAQARNPRGENQYYTALALHKLYTRGYDDEVRVHTQKAYRSVLDNYFGSVTYFKIGDLLVPQPLKDLVANLVVTPENNRLLQLFDSEADALGHLNQWGYDYDFDTAILTRR